MVRSVGPWARALGASAIVGVFSGCGSTGDDGGEGAAQDGNTAPADSTASTPPDSGSDASDAHAGADGASPHGEGAAESGQAPGDATGAGDGGIDASDAGAVDAGPASDTGSAETSSTGDTSPADGEVADSSVADVSSTDAVPAKDATVDASAQDAESADTAVADVEDAASTDVHADVADAASTDAAKDTGAADTGSGMHDAASEGGSCATGASFTGGLTHYTQTSTTACGQPWPDAWSVDNNFPAVAMNTALFDQGSAASACNKCVSVTGTTGATATFVVVDECPAFSNTMWCQANHLDIDGVASYNLVENGAPGSIDNSPGVPIAAPYPGPVTWKYVPCPWTAGIIYLFQPNGLSSGTYFYLALNVYHTRYGIQTVRYRSGASWVDLQARTDDQAGHINGNFVINGVAIPDPIDLQVVDEYGQTIEDDGVSWSAPTTTFQSTKQFQTCN
jgi:hypothetical protein